MVAIIVIGGILLMFFIATGYILLPIVPLFILLIFLYYWHRKNDVLTFDTHHLEFKFTPLQSKRFVKYKTIIDLKYNSKKKVVLLITEKKKVKLPVGGIEDQDAEEIISFLKKQVQQNNIAV
ncbi:hypothetical protein SAMN05421766_103684 [Zobellia uliginosa]|uniref:PH domain-containing protein n=2 Tax=Zobellia uliginosa TaxID=143224 RepID=A0ABY1KT09_9FLAO|nr:hypothetical protein [Zobellia uliginosa]SIS73235.1 hypothetical protein SAMN05421766_103684 [Zobellia uliginosa]